MIARTRIRKFFASTWLRFFFPFSCENTKSPLSQDAQRAAWASIIVNKIYFAKGSDIITNPSLREQILSLKHPDGISDPKNSQQIRDNKCIIFDEAPRNDIMNIFQSGTLLQTKIFKQQRIKYAQQKSSNDKSLLRNIVFCPNVLVTQPMFSTLMRQNSNILIYGKFGISKTFALVMFNYLSSIINNFVYQSFLDGTKKKELNLLKNNNLLICIPKLFYWSMNLSDDQSVLKSLIIAQATELSENQREQLLKIMNFSEFINSLRRKYRDKDITVRIVIDKINILTSLFKQWNYFYKKYQQNQKQWNQQQKEYNLIQQPGQLFRYRMKQFQKLGQCTFYISPINIDQELIGTQRPNDQFRTIDIRKDHEQIRKICIKYVQNLNTKWGCNDFSHFFWFQIQKRLKRRDSLTQTQIAELKGIFYQKVKDAKWPKYLRFVDIRKMLQKQSIQLKQVYNNFQQIKNIGEESPSSKGVITQNIQESVCFLTNRLVWNCIRDYREHLLKFLTETNLQIKQRKLDLFFALSYEAQKRIDQDNVFQIQLIHLSELLGLQFQQLEQQKKQQQKLKRFLFVKQYLSSPSAHEQLFSIQKKNQQTMVRFLWTPAQFIIVVNKILFWQRSGIKYFDLQKDLVLQ